MRFFFALMQLTALGVGVLILFCFFLPAIAALTEVEIAAAI